MFSTKHVRSTEFGRIDFGLACSDQAPDQILSPFSCTAPLQYVPKILFAPATIDCFTINKTENALHSETVMLSYIGRNPITRSLSN